MITATDKRTPAASFSTGTPGLGRHDPADVVQVQPLTSYMEAHGTVHAHSEPYPLARHLAQELESHGFAKIIGPKTKPEGDEGQGADSDVEQPDDASRLPDQDQVTASTVPALPGAEPQRPAFGPVPPAAVSTAPTPARRRGRQPATRG